MQSLRQARFLARLVLAWFALAVGVAVAAPVLQPEAQWLCSGGGMKLVAADMDDEAATPPTLDCPLCGQASAPAPSGLVWAASTAAATGAAAPGAAQSAGDGTPLPPARGPPLSVLS